MFLIGADPEVFLVKNGKFVSAETREGTLLPGTKAKPFKTSKGAVQVDGVAAEFNIDPAKNTDEFYDNIKTTLKDLNGIIRKVDPEVRLTAVPTAKFDPDYFKSLPEKTLELGCEPDFDAYTEKPNPRPSTDRPWRTGAGHIHFGWTKDADPFSTGHMMDCVLLTKMCDKYLYTASLDWDTDNDRRQLYGKVGSFRPKPYGMEYRVLSNAWLKNAEVVRNVHRIANAIIKGLDSGGLNVDPGELANIAGNYTDNVVSKLGKWMEW